MTTVAEVLAELRLDTRQAENETRQRLSQLGGTAGRNSSEGFNSQVSRGTSRLPSMIGPAFVAGIAAIGAAAGKALMGALEQMDVGATIAAKIGAVGGVNAARSYGALAGKVYSENFGSSLGDVGEALTNVVQLGLDKSSASAGTTAKKITEDVLTVASLTGESSLRIARAAQTLVRNGMVKTTTEAFDLITKGQQSGANAAEDLLDTINEYSSQWVKLGITGPQAMGLLSQGIKAGARDSDFLADGLKEFSIRAVDGSKTTAEGFKALGLDAAKTAAVFAKGGPAAAQGLQTVLDRLRAMPDPLKRSQAAVALFGTKAEDLGSSLFALDLKTASAEMGDFAGATKAAADTLASSPKAAWERFKRVSEANLTALGGKLLFFGFQAKDALSKVWNSTPVQTWVTKITGYVGTLKAALLKALTSDWTKNAVASLVRFGTSFLRIANQVVTKYGPMVVAAFKAAASFVSSAVRTIGDVLHTVFEVGWPKVVKAATDAWEKGLKPAFEALVEFWNKNQDWIKPLLQGLLLAVGAITAFVAGTVVVVGAIAAMVAAFGIFTAVKFIGMIGQAATAITSFVANVYRTIVTFLTVTLPNTFNGVVTWFSNLPSRIGGALAALPGLIARLFQLALTGLATLVGTGLGTIVRFFVNLPGRVVGAASALWALLSTTFARGVATILGFVATVPSRVAAYLSTLPGRLLALGTSAMAALRDGLSNGVHWVASLVESIPGRIGDIGKDFFDRGMNMVHAIVAGLERGVGWVADTARKMAHNFIDAFKSAMGIQSPSKVMEQMGSFLVEGLSSGLSKLSSVKSTVTRLKGYLAEAFAGGSITASTKSLVSSIADGYQTALTKLTYASGVLSDKMKAAQGKLTEAQGAWSDQYSRAFQGVMDAVQLGENDTVKGVIDKLTGTVTSAEQLKADIAKLTKAGLSKDLLAQLANSGVSGAATAHNLASATPAELKKINELQKRLSEAAKGEATQVANSLYGGAVSAAKGLVDGIKAQQSAIEKQMTAIAAAAVNAITKTLLPSLLNSAKKAAAEGVAKARGALGKATASRTDAQGRVARDTQDLAKASARYAADQAKRAAAQRVVEADADKLRADTTALNHAHGKKLRARLADQVAKDKKALAAAQTNLGRVGRDLSGDSKDISRLREALPKDQKKAAEAAKDEAAKKAALDTALKRQSTVINVYADPGTPEGRADMLRQLGWVLGG